MKPKLTQPLKWHGGKHYLAKKIIDLMPAHLHYVEPYAGGLSVLLNKDPFDPRHQWGKKSFERGTSEIVNDIHHSLQNFWDVLKGSKSFRRFQRILEATPFSEIEFNRAANHTPESDPDVDSAVRFFIRCRQSRAGSFKDFGTLSRNRTRRKMNEQSSAWLNAVEGLSQVHDRLKRVVILCRDALDVIKQQDGEKTLFYLDPPYLHSTRASTDNYKYEMSKSDHRQLLEVICSCKGSIMLSAYKNLMYQKMLRKPFWKRHDFEIDNKVAGGSTKRMMTESVWVNF